MAATAVAPGMDCPLEAGSRHSVSLAEILSALSFALDLTEGAVPGHALRSCVLGMRLAREIGLDAEQVASLYYAFLLKDVGCSSNAGRLCQIIGGGDERRVKAGAKLEDWTRPSRPKLSTLRLLWENVLPGSGPLRRVVGIARIGMTQHRNNEEMISLRCDRGASIVRKLGLGDTAAEAVRELDEHWDGSGYPERRRGAEIPIGARILAVAQHLDVFATEQGTGTARAVLRERRGRWFDPELVDAAESLARRGVLWRTAMSHDPHGETRRAALELAPAGTEALEIEDVDTICEAFADVVDAKSSFTFRHSMGVTDTAVTIAAAMGLNEERRRLVRRAALLHDIGKLRVPNSILDKPGRLSAEEWALVREHPVLTREILSRIGPFQEMAAIAGAHHERLDGTGYPVGLADEQIPVEARIVAVADVYAAMTEDRPYRGGMAMEQVIAVMSREAPRRLDGDCFAALLGVLG